MSILLENILAINDGLKLNSTSVSANTTLTTSSKVVTRVDTDAGTYTITLPSASSATNHYYIIIDDKGNANNNNITIDTDGGNLSGASSQIIDISYGNITVFSDGTNWFII